MPTSFDATCSVAGAPAFDLELVFPLEPQPAAQTVMPTIAKARAPLSLLDARIPADDSQRDA